MKKNKTNRSFSSCNACNLNYLPWVVWGLGCIFYFYEFLLQVSPSVMGNLLMKDFSFTAHSLGILAGVYFYSYAIMQIPAGIMMDKFGSHRLLTFASGICAIGSIAFGSTHSFVMAAFARFLIGFGSAFAVVGTLKLAATWFKPERFALLTGLMITIGMLGAINGEAPLARLIHAVGWRHSMFLLGIAGLILTALIFFIVKDAPSKKETMHQTGLPPASSNSYLKPPGGLFHGLLTAIKNKQLWLVAIYGGLMYMPTPVFCGLWGVPFLTKKFSLDQLTASGLIILVFVGWAIGSPLWGILSDRIARRLVPMYIGSVGALVTLLMIVYFPIKHLLVLQLLLLLFGIFSSGFLTAFSIAKEISDRLHVATNLSFMNMMNMIGIALIQPFIGQILDKLWTGGMSMGIRSYSLSNYQIAIAVLPIGLFIALLLLPFIKETHCHSDQ